MSDFHPEWFGGNADAAQLVSDLCFVAHVWDDLIDKDKPVSQEQINAAFELALFAIPNNPFYLAHRAGIAPLIYSGILGFVTANRMEQSGDEHQLEIAHGLRYGAANVAAYAVAVTNSRQDAETILPEAWKHWMPERIADYMKEHVDAA